ncbi:MAG: alpha-L-fucosidase, partial [Bacteroidales bacterium]|nr:alpha-L-fucosidase [Bacteroidales bacterium]
MKKSIVFWMLFLVSINFTLSAQETPAWAKETPKQKTERMAWWTHDRFGMFIHWGTYSLVARHEWVKNFEHISDADYQKYF